MVGEGATWTSVTPRHSAARIHRRAWLGTIPNPAEDENAADKDSCRQPDPEYFAQKRPHTPLAEEAQADLGNFDGPKWHEPAGHIDGPEKSDAKPAVGERVQDAVRRGHHEEE